MYNLTKEDNQLLRSLGSSTIGREFIELLERMSIGIGDVTGINGDYGAQVEGRKVAKGFVNMLIEKMKTRIEDKAEVLGNDNFE